MLAFRPMAGGRIWSVRVPARKPAAAAITPVDRPVDRLLERNLARPLERGPVVVEGKVVGLERRVEKEPPSLSVDPVPVGDLLVGRRWENHAVVRLVLFDREPAGIGTRADRPHNLVDLRGPATVIEAVALEHNLAVGDTGGNVTGPGAQRVVDLLK